MQEEISQEEARVLDIEDRIDRSTTSFLEHQRDTYYGMVADRLDKQGVRFLETLMLIDREIISREIAGQYAERNKA
jgi:hypothetical protein